GTFDNAGPLNGGYTPGPADIAAGTVSVRPTTKDPAEPCLPAGEYAVISNDPGANVEAGTTNTICAGPTSTLTGVIGGSATSATWTTSGDGSFNNASALNAVYTPGPSDIAAGTVTLTLTTDDPAGACPPVSDDVVVIINAVATVNAGPDQAICAGE